MQKHRRAFNPKNPGKKKGEGRQKPTKSCLVFQLSDYRGVPRATQIVFRAVD
jgi:hypothetical protein